MDLENVLYRKVIRWASKSPDGETPTVIELTEEINGFAIHRQDYENGTTLLEWLYGDKSDAIERAVELAIEIGHTMPPCEYCGEHVPNPCDAPESKDCRNLRAARPELFLTQAAKAVRR